MTDLTRARQIDNRLDFLIPRIAHRAAMLRALIIEEVRATVQRDVSKLRRGRRALEAERRHIVPYAEA